MHRILKKIAILFLWVMSVQYIPVEGYLVSYVKLSLLVASPLIWFLSFKTFSKGFILGLIFIVSITFSVFYNEQNIRFLSLAYKIGFIVMFIMYYDLIHLRNALSIETFKSFIKKLISAYAFCLIIQQVFIIIGVTEFSLINLTQFLDRGLGSNSLSLEPSHSARILTVAMLVLLRLEQVTSPKNKLLFKPFFRKNKKIIFLFFWCMLTMNSGTAIIGLIILSTFFIKKQYLLGLIPVLILLIVIIPRIENQSLDRVKNIFSAVETLDTSQIKITDYSAASRIVPFINTINYIDITETSTWIGSGTDSNINSEYLSEEQFIGEIRDYGLICYFASLLLFFGCCARKLFSIETLVFVLLLATTINNVAYTWSILLLFTTSKYFIDDLLKKNQLS